MDNTQSTSPVHVIQPLGGALMHLELARLVPDDDNVRAKLTGVEELAAVGLRTATDSLALGFL